MNRHNLSILKEQMYIGMRKHWREEKKMFSNSFRQRKFTFSAIWIPIIHLLLLDPFAYFTKLRCGYLFSIFMPIYCIFVYSVQYCRMRCVLSNINLTHKLLGWFPKKSFKNRRIFGENPIAKFVKFEWKWKEGVTVYACHNVSLSSNYKHRPISLKFLRLLVIDYQL